MVRPARRLAALLAVLSVLVSAAAFAQPIPVSVEFSVHAPGLPKGATVYLSGGTPALGNWAPDAIPMERQGKDTWRKIILFDRAMVVEYQYTLGTETRQPADERGQPLPRFSTQLRRNLKIRDEVVAWTDADTQVEDPGRVTGELRYHRHVRDDTVPARDIAVWLPRFYELQKRRDYPVLYLNDGQDLFDPATAAGGRDWGVDETLDRLIEEELVEPMIVVGIYSTEDRLEEYVPSERGEAYMRFLVETVKPLIDRRYRTRPGRHNTFVGGAELGGVIAFATAWTHPEVFGAAISLSPAFRIEGRLDTIPWFEARVRSDPRPVFFYLDSGGQGIDAQIRPGVEAMAEQLKGWGYRPERHYVLVRDLDAHHGPAAWSRRFPGALTRSVRGARNLESLAGRGAGGTAPLAGVSGGSPAATSIGAGASLSR
jgi:predicted alpha/beta superfamily hydrolase